MDDQGRSVTSSSHNHLVDSAARDTRVTPGSQITPGLWPHVCQCCNALFYSRKSCGVKFCGARCRKRASIGHKQWTTAKTCQQCGAVFVVTQPFQPHKFCSNACRQKHYREEKKKWASL